MDFRLRVNDRAPARIRVLPSLLPKQIELQNTGDMIQWRYVGETWFDLIAVIDLAPTAADLLTLLLTVDGAGSGLDADTLDGLGSNDFLQVPETSVQEITATGTAAVNTGTSLLVLNLAAPGTIDLTLPSVAARNGAPLRITDWTGNTTAITATPNGSDEIMNATGAVALGGSAGAGLGMAFAATLVPISDLSGWIV